MGETPLTVKLKITIFLHDHSLHSVVGTPVHEASGANNGVITYEPLCIHPQCTAGTRGNSSKKQYKHDAAKAAEEKNACFDAMMMPDTNLHSAMRNRQA